MNDLPVSPNCLKRIERQTAPGLDMAMVPREDLCEYHLTLQLLPGEKPAQLVERLYRIVRERDLQVLKHDVFGRLGARAEALAACERLFGCGVWPITWVEGGCCSNRALGGMHVFAVSGVNVQTMSRHGRPIGRVFTDAYARHFILGDVRPTELDAPRPVQASQMFQNLESYLLQAGMVFSDLVRTWLFMDDILAWYGPFNEVRTEIFTQRNVFSRWVPASTGVGARNSEGAAMVAGAWALQILSPDIEVREVPSPLQCSASSYGSSFSRAIQMRTPGWQRVLVSGTASIAPDGRSARPGDTRGQIDLTMEVVEAILQQCRMTCEDITRATIYFRYPQDAPHWTAWCKDYGLVRPPGLVVQSVVCRDELLFEIELDAIAPLEAPDA